MFGDEKSVILLLKFAGVRKLLKVFAHETVQQPLWLQYRDLRRMAMICRHHVWCVRVHQQIFQQGSTSYSHCSSSSLKACTKALGFARFSGLPLQGLQASQMRIPLISSFKSSSGLKRTDVDRVMVRSKGCSLPHDI